MNFLATRIESGQVTVASLSCETKYKDPELVVMAIKCAIANWGKTEDGALAIEQSCNDFNFGDLANEQENEGLVKCLEEQGIRNMSVEITDCSGEISFDTVLCPNRWETDEDE